jgi:intein-encoded DNA endonuclease-like protein/DNA-binding CsgD family transcriptional regulator
LARKFVSLYTDGGSSHSIARKFDVDHKTVLSHLYAASVAIRSKSDSIKMGLAQGRIKPIAKPHVLPPYSKNLSPEKAYVLGVLAGDGWLSYYPTKRRCQIGLETVDEEFADEFRRCLNKVYGLNPSKKKVFVKNPKWKDKYRVRSCCKAACEDLLSFGVPFRQDDWLIPPAIKNASIDVQASYLRGFFDSEGSVEANGRRIKGTSSNLPGLVDISALLRDLRIRSRIICLSKGNVGDVRIQDRASVELFAENVGFTIKRKKEKLHWLLARYKLWKTPPSNVLKLEPEMRHLRDLGLAYEEIAKQLSLSMGTVWRHLNKNDTSEVKAFICSSNRNTTL